MSTGAGYIQLCRVTDVTYLIRWAVNLRAFFADYDRMTFPGWSSVVAGVVERRRSRVRMYA